MENYYIIKGYTGDINYSQEDDCYYGVVKDITGLVSYEGSTWENLEKDFRGLFRKLFNYINIRKSPFLLFVIEGTAGEVLTIHTATSQSAADHTL